MISNKLHNISRNKTQNLWQVRVTRNGIARSKAFSDSKYSGSAPIALLAAIGTRDEMLTTSLTKFTRNY